MQASTSRLAVGGNEIGLVHGINTAPDPRVDNRRHQKALSTRLDAKNGEILRTHSIWVSHSFDQRLLYDGEGITELHLGDAYPRAIAFGREHQRYPLFHIKGPTGLNSTWTSLGNMALIENDRAYDYIGLFATEPWPDTAPGSRTRNLAIVRVKGSDNSVDPSLPDTLTVISKDIEQTNRLRWLTHYATNPERVPRAPKLIGLGDDRYIVLWEEWRPWQEVPSWLQFQAVYGLVIDARGNTLRGPKPITGEYRLPSSDDAFLLDGRAGWMTGNAEAQELNIHLVDTALNYEIVTLD
jgi:hypothetical protein